MSSPNDLLSNYDILFHGNKYKNQPSCPQIIIENINFAIGLLNSDGCYVFNKRQKNFCFSNTVKSIIENMKECLYLNNINYKQTLYIYKNQPTWKPRMSLRIGQKESREKILNCEYCKWKN